MLLGLRICIDIKWENRERYQIISPDRGDIIRHKSVGCACKLTFTLMFMYFSSSVK
jgi:hypothetical protein